MIKLGLHGGIEADSTGFLYSRRPHPDPSVRTSRQEACVFSIPTEYALGSTKWSRLDLWSLSRVRIFMMESDVEGEVTAMRHHMRPSCRWHEDCLDSPTLAEACGQTMGDRWTRTHQMGYRHFGVGSRELSPWEPLDFDPIYYGERLDLLVNVRWTDKRVGAAVARVTVLLAMNRYVRS